MIYEYIRNIDATDKFIYIVVIIASIVFSTRLPMTPYGIVGAISGILLVYYFNEHREYLGASFIASMKVILNSDVMDYKNNPYLPNNSELLIFLDNHREYYQYNPTQWNSIIRHINNFLKLTYDIEHGTTRRNLDYDVLKETKIKVLNTYQSFIHRIPHTEESSNKFHEGMDLLQNILNTSIDNTHRIVIMNNKDITINSAFHYKNHPGGRDLKANMHYSFF